MGCRRQIAQAVIIAVVALVGGKLRAAFHLKLMVALKKIMHLLGKI